MFKLFGYIDSNGSGSVSDVNYDMEKNFCLFIYPIKIASFSFKVKQEIWNLNPRYQQNINMNKSYQWTNAKLFYLHC